MTTPPVRRPVTASTAASHTGKLFVQSGVRGRAVVSIVIAVLAVELRGKAVPFVFGVAVVVERAKLFTFVKM